MQENARLYRGQPKGRRLIPSGLRPDCLKYMVEELSKFNIDTKKYEKCVTQIAIPSEYFKYFKGVEPSASNAFYAYWLSLVNCAIAVNTNRIFHNFCKSPFFYNNVHKDGAGIFGVNISEIGELCYNYAKDFFDNDQEVNTLHIQHILHDYAFFQHLNHVFSKLDGSDRYKSLFPTLVMDWTWDYDKAKEFAGSNGNIVSINFDAYKKWTLFKNHTFINLNDNQNQKDLLTKTPVFGFESYRDTETWDDNKFDWDSWDNNLMIEQKGAVIFWPWTFTIEEMINNELGKLFEFRKVQ